MCGKNRLEGRKIGKVGEFSLVLSFRNFERKNQRNSNEPNHTLDRQRFGEKIGAVSLEITEEVERALYITPALKS